MTKPTECSWTQGGPDLEIHLLGGLPLSMYSYVCLDAITKCHRLGALNSWHLVSHSPGGQEVQDQSTGTLILGEHLPPSL